MSLYEGLIKKTTSSEPDPTGDNVASPASATTSWNKAGLKLLQSQIALKKAQATQAMRDRSRVAQAEPSAAAPVVDLSNKRKDAGSADLGAPAAKQPSLLKPRKPLVLDALPLSFIPHAAKDAPTVIFGEFTVEDEYNPLIPNDYIKCQAEREIQRKIQREKDNLREIEAAKLRALERSKRDDEKEAERELQKRQMGAAIAPPMALMEADRKVLETPMPPPAALGGAAAPKGMNLAARMMEKMGYKKGSGLGKSGQGMTKALNVEKIGHKEGRIIHADHAEEPSGSAEASESDDMFAKPDEPAQAQPAAAAAPPAVVGTPSKVVLLRNMVGKGEVDDELEPEIKEEMQKYGQVNNVMIYELPTTTDSDAIRIFVEFDDFAQSKAAIQSLNGRFFGGRQVRASFYDFDKYKNFELADEE